MRAERKKIKLKIGPRGGIREVTFGGVPLKKIGAGSFRSVYKIDDDRVLKIERRTSSETHTEWRNYCYLRLRPEVRDLLAKLTKPFEVHTGHTAIVAENITGKLWHKYAENSEAYSNAQDLAREIESAGYVNDIHSANMKMDKNGKWRLIDLGGGAGCDDL